MNYTGPIHHTNPRNDAPRSVAMGRPIESFNLDGSLIVRRQNRRRSLPWHGVTLILVTLLLFKAAMHVSLGPASYEARVVELRSGNAIQQVGGWLLSAEPATLWLSSTIKSVVR